MNLLFRAVTQMNFVMTLVIVLFLAWMGLNPAQAQQQLPTVVVTDRNDPPNGRLPLDTTSQTGSRLGLTPRETPASVTIIDRETIEARGARDTQEVLNSAPGVVSSAPPGQAGFVVMRGFQSSQITQLFDGISVQYDVIAARPVDSWLYDRIEVIGGPSSYLYGAGAVGGSINYVTKLANREGSTQDFLVRHGSFDSNQVAYGINRPVGPSSWVRFDASHQDSDGYVKPSQSRSEVYALSWLWDINDRLSHTLAYNRVDEQRLPYWGTPLLKPGLNSTDPATRFINYNVSDGTYANQVQWLRSILEYKIADTTRLKNTLYHYDAERLYRNLEVYRYDATNTNVERGGVLAQRHGQTLTGNRFELFHKASLLGLPTSWSTGVDLMDNHQTRYPFSASNISATTGAALSVVNPSSPNVGTFGQFAPGQNATNPDRDHHVITRALFAENRTTVAPGLNLVTGLRHDSIDLNVRNYRAVTATDPAFFSKGYSANNGRLGLVWDISRDANIYLQYSMSADPPAGVLATATFGQLRDFNLTKGKQLELGSKLDFWERRATATLATYRITRRNIAIPDPTNSANVLVVGQQSSQGVEGSLGVRFSPQWRLQGNLAYTAPRFDSFTEVVAGASVSRAGNDPANTPRVVANTWLTWNPLPDWEAGVAWRRVGSVWGDNANTLKVDGYSLFDAQVSYKVNRNTSIVARGRNLADKEYVRFATGTPMFIYGEPRSFDIALRATF